MARNLTRLTEPLVRENGVLRPATWDEALDRAAAGFSSAVAASAGRTRSASSRCSKATNEVNFVAQKFARVAIGTQQHRHLQPHLTRSQRRRSGDSVRSGRRDELLPRGRGDGRHRPVGLERAGDAPDLLPPRPEGGAQRRAAVRRRPAAHRLAPSGPTAGSASTSAPTSPSPTRSRARSSTPACTTASFIERATTGFEEYAASVEQWTLERGERETGVPADVIRELAPRLRARRPRAALLDARHHRAPQRRRQRARADQPRAAVRPRRPLRLRPEPAARAEQRAGRRRHGRHPEQAARLPGHRARRRGPRASSSAAWGVDDRAEVRLAPDRRCSRRWSAAS